MIFEGTQTLLPKVLTHKDCGGHVEQAEWMRRYMPDFYTCPKCSTLLHRNNLKRELWMVV